MKILLFGGSGQLGYDVGVRCSDLNFQLIAPVPSEVDITEREQVVRLAKTCSPDVILNCAAYTAVDKAEEEREQAFLINEEGARNAAEAALKCGCRLIHLSTDYVFSGDGDRPLKESDPTGPINVYGESKLAGEKAILEILGDRGLVVRTSSLHGQKGINFVHTMIRLFKEKDSLQVVNDQYMSPTWAGWLAEVLLDLARIPCGGVVHASGAGVTSWFHFATAIYELVRPTIAKEVTIVPIPASQFPRPARRPAYSAFDCSKLAGLIGRSPVKWEEGLKRHLSEIGYR